VASSTARSWASSTPPACRSCSGTYDRDAAGEYNAAAFVAPRTGLLGFYRKTRAFPLTEYVPGWLDGPTFRRWLPWTGTWQQGSGARVFPLRLADGREIPVLPLICLDDMDAGLAIDGARLGAQAILTMSNDSWFADPPQGAELHQAAAAFRSIETRLPQFRVTPNGYSAVIDATGSVIAAARMGERTLVIGEVPVRDPPRTLMVAWGDWVGAAALAFLMLLGAAAALRTWRIRAAPEASGSTVSPALPADVAVLPPVARLVAGLLRAFARGSLLWMGAMILFGDGALQAKTLVQMRTFAALFLVPEAGRVVRAARVRRARFDRARLARADARRETPRTLAERHRCVEPWRVPVPGRGASLRLVSGEGWRYGLAHADPAGLARALGRGRCRARTSEPAAASGDLRAGLCGDPARAP
jgi:apolipoprotein N-acyltransferase